MRFLLGAPPSTGHPITHGLHDSLMVAVRVFHVNTSLSKIQCLSKTPSERGRRNGNPHGGAGRPWVRSVRGCRVWTPALGLRRVLRGLRVYLSRFLQTFRSGAPRTCLGF
jgi:hypothetical protein